MNTPHTPGPWEIETAKRFIGDSKETYDSLCVTFSSPLRAKLICELGADTLPDNPHNACLIAAAPDLLDALQAIVDAFGDQNSLLIDQCKAALRKAKGEA